MQKVSPHPGMPLEEASACSFGTLHSQKEQQAFMTLWSTNCNLTPKWQKFPLFAKSIRFLDHQDISENHTTLGHSICFLYCTSTPKLLQLCAQAYRNKQRTHFLSWADINIYQYLKHFSTIMLLNNFKLLDSAQIGTYRQVGSWKLLMCDFYWSHQQTKYAPTQLAIYCLKEVLNSVSDTVPQWVYLQVEIPSLSFILPHMAIYPCFTFKSLIIWKVL